VVVQSRKEPIAVFLFSPPLFVLRLLARTMLPIRLLVAVLFALVCLAGACDYFSPYTGKYNLFAKYDSRCKPLKMLGSSLDFANLATVADWTTYFNSHRKAVGLPQTFKLPANFFQKSAANQFLYALNQERVVRRLHPVKVSSRLLHDVRVMMSHGEGDIPSMCWPVIYGGKASNGVAAGGNPLEAVNALLYQDTARGGDATKRYWGHRNTLLGNYGPHGVFGMVTKGVGNGQYQFYIIACLPSAHL